MIDEEASLLSARLKALNQRLRRETQTGDLSRTGWQVLVAIDRAAGPITPGEIAVEARMTSSNVAATLRELADAGLITREKDQLDGRRVLLQVSSAGHERVREYRQTKDAWLRRAIDAELDDAEQHLLIQAGQLIARLAESEVTA